MPRSLALLVLALALAAPLSASTRQCRPNRYNTTAER